MFIKPFKIKSNSILKGSERKKLLNHLHSSFPKLADFIPHKGDLSLMKVFTFKGETALVYFLAQDPIFFVVEDTLFPTVYTLWKFPDLLPSVATCAVALSKLSGGADLMLPGIEAASLEGLDFVQPGDVCSIRLSGTEIPLGVGVFLLSGPQLLAEPKRGKAVAVKHLYKDLLWAHGTKAHPQIVIQNTTSPPDNLEEEEEHNTAHDQSYSHSPLNGSLANLSLDEKAAEGDSVMPEYQGESNIDGEEGPIEDISQDVEEVEPIVKTPAELMDDTLHFCFLSALKTSGKKIELPILSSTFYKVHVLGQCPSGYHLDIKKTSYKKLSVFLKEMQAKGLLEVKELSKGVESIVSWNLQHHLLHHISSLPSLTSEGPEDDPPSSHISTLDESYIPPEIRELYAITASVLPLFKPHYKKGDALSSGQVRQALTDYIKTNELNQKNIVVLDGHLSDALLNKGESIETLSWEEVNSRCLSRMQPAVELTFPGEAPILRKGKLDLIDITVGQRSGNKKVTLVTNLETFRIDPTAFARRLQQQVAASTSVSPLPGGGGKGGGGRRGMQVLVQGNQTRFLGNLLLNTYKIPKKYIQGLESSTAGKKKK